MSRGVLRSRGLTRISRAPRDNITWSTCYHPVQHYRRTRKPMRGTPLEPGDRSSIPPCPCHTCTHERQRGRGRGSEEQRLLRALFEQGHHLPRTPPRPHQVYPLTPSIVLSLSLAGTSPPADRWLLLEARHRNSTTTTQSLLCLACHGDLTPVSPLPSPCPLPLGLLGPHGAI